MNRLTGNKNADTLILQSLDDKDLINMCSTDKYLKSICDDDRFWVDRIANKYGKETLAVVPNNKDMTYREFYTSGKAKNYALCLELHKIPKHSQLAIDDFYNPEYGIINKYIVGNVNIIEYLILKITLEKMISLPLPRGDLFEQEKLEKLLLKKYENMDSQKKYLTLFEKEYFKTLLYFQLSAPYLLRSIAKTNPNIVKALSPRPEDKFRLISYIHDGFRMGKIPLNILWSELCNLPYILDYNLLQQ